MLSKLPVNLYKETVLGYDIRTRPAPWREERRRPYLLGDAAAPLSVDMSVWPSSRAAAHHGEIETDFCFVEKFFEKNFAKRGDDDVWLIAITLRKESYRKEFSGWGMGAIDGAWKFLGYDIADQAMLSGLSNCMYTGKEIEILKPVWSPELNQYNLFDDIACAVKFRTLTELRVPEHAPFAVYGLYRILEPS